MYPSLSLLAQYSLLPITISALIIGNGASSGKCYAQTPPSESSQNTSKDEATKKAEPPSAKSYIGLGGTIGLSGNNTALGTGGLAILSRNVLNDLLSIHSNNVVFGTAIPSASNALTLNFPIRDSTTQEIVVSPFLGAGIQLRNIDGLYISPLAVGGVDIPLNKSLTGTIRLEAAFPNTGNTDMGVSIGIGYNF
ncbi:MAG: hypothetical protein M1G31_00045 [Pseudanabaena sp. Salubria-1]|jgi:hypothetical protein|nr:hypothetical protein [Pseudanabaena sp. Salubria-1]